jgi:hypothetical protein
VCTYLIGIATAAFGTVASIVSDGATDRLEDLDDWLRRLTLSLEIFDESARHAVAAWYAAHWSADDDFDAEEIIDFVSPQQEQWPTELELSLPKLMIVR